MDSQPTDGTDWSPQLEELARQFHAKWQSGAQPQIEAFVREVESSGLCVEPALRERLLVKLLAIETAERRQRGVEEQAQAATDRPGFDDDVRRLPELATPEEDYVAAEVVDPGVLVPAETLYIDGFGRQRPATDTPSGVWGAIGYCLLLLAVQFVVGLFLAPFVQAQGWKPNEPSLLLMAAGHVVMLLVALGLIRKPHLANEAWHPWSWPRSPQWLLVIALVPPLFVAHSAIFSWITQPESAPARQLWVPAGQVVAQNLFSYIEVAMLEIARQSWGILFLDGCLLPALAEEIFFRLFLGRGLVARYGPSVGVVITSLLFGVMHVWPPQASFAFDFGIVLHLVFLATRSIWASMLVHGLNNMLAFGLMKLALDGTLNVAGPNATIHVSGGLFATSIAAVVTLFWLLYGSRATGNGDIPAHTARGEVPPAHCVGRPSTRSTTWLRACLAIASCLAFIAMFALSARHWASAALVNEALALCNSGGYEQARLRCDRAVEWDPRSSWAFQIRALSHVHQNNTSQARADCERAIQLDAEAAFAYMVRAGIQGTHDLAIADYTRAVELNPDLVDAYRGRAVAFNNTAKYGNALTDCATVLRFMPDDADILRIRGFAYNALAEYDKAIADCTKAIKISPTLAEAYHVRGQAFLGCGRFPEGLLDLNEAIELGANNYWYLASRAQIHQGLGDYPAAIADLTEAIEIESAELEAEIGRAELPSNLASHQLLLAGLQQNLGDHEAAMASYRRALAIFEKLAERAPTAGDYQSNVAAVHTMIGALQQGMNDIEGAIGSGQRALDIVQQLAHGYPSAIVYQLDIAGRCYGLGYLETMRGNIEGARGWYSRAADAWQRAGELNGGPLPTPVRVSHAYAMAQSGHGARAIAEAQSLAQVGDLDAGSLYNLASLLAVCSASTADDAALRERHSGTALEFLNRARQAGFFQVAANVAHFKKDPDFAALRQRSDYASFLETVEHALRLDQE